MMNKRYTNKHLSDDNYSNQNNNVHNVTQFLAKHSRRGLTDYIFGLVF
jgi:hypothetical protein